MEPLYDDITTINGIVSCFIYTYNNKMYYFFGDKHFSRSGGCKQQGYKCDHFDYTFTDTFTYGTNCTDIGPLLHNWFNYNNYYNIKTDFYIEESYTKNDRTVNQTYYDIIENRKKNIYDEPISPFEKKSWMEITSLIMHPCLIKNKKNCIYSPNVHLHYIDVRYLEQNNDNIDISPYSLDILKTYINDNTPKTLQDFIYIRDNVYIFIEFLINNYDYIFDAMFSIYGYNNIQYHEHVLFREVFNHIKLFTVTKIINGQMVTCYKVAWELYKLSLNNKILSNNIILYIYNIGKNIINILKQKFIFVKNQTLKKFDKIPSIDILLSSKLNMGIRDLKNIVNQYDILLLDIQSLSMDAYTLARIFTQHESTEIIVYAGNYHIDIHINFFNQYLNLIPLINNPYIIKGNRCIHNNDLPLYLSGNKYRKFVSHFKS
jgi:CheY-like chemotaxis protein